MPRVGLNTSEVVASGAELADEAGIGSVSLAALAGRLGVKPPALYKHVAKQIGMFNGKPFVHQSSDIVLK